MSPAPSKPGAYAAAGHGRTMPNADSGSTANTTTGPLQGTDNDNEPKAARPGNDCRKHSLSLPSLPLSL